MKLSIWALVVLATITHSYAQGATRIQFAQTSYAVPENAPTATVAVKRTGDLSGPATVEFTASGGSAVAGTDFAAEAGTLTFAAGQAQLSFSVPILDNAALDGDRTIHLRLANPVGSTIGPIAAATLVIQDNERSVQWLDSSFRPAFTHEGFVLAAALPDGKVLVSGNVTNNNNRATAQVARLQEDGAIDPTFQAQIRLQAPSNVGTPRLLIAPAADGKVLIGGWFTNVGGLARTNVARLNPDGSVDESFDAGTGATGALNGATGLSDVHVLADGMVLIAGGFSRVNGVNRSGIARLHPDGSLDTNFNARVNDVVSAVHELPDGQLLLHGNFTMVNGVSRRMLARLNSDGAVDDTFRPRLNSNFRAFSPAAVQPDGKILLPGAVLSSSSNDALARLNADGTVDTSFAKVTVTQADGNQGSLWLAAPLPDGRILIGGYFANVNGVPRGNLAMLRANGTLDGNFNLDVNSPPEQVLPAPGNKILLAGSYFRLNTRSPFGLGRIHSDTAQVRQIGFSAPQFTAGAGPVAELRVLRYGESSGLVSVDYATVSQAIPVGGTLTFLPRETEKTISLALPDSMYQFTRRTVEVALSRPTGGAELGLSRAMVEIDPDSSVELARESAVVDENAGAATITLRRRGNVSRLLAFDYATADETAVASTDYLARAGIIVFGPGESERSFQVPILDNSEPEGDRSFRIVLSNPGIELTPLTNRVTIRDNERRVILNPAFGIGTGPAGPITPIEVTALGLQPDGKALVAGRFTHFNGVPRNGLVRLHPNGAVDLDFDVGKGTGLEQSIYAIHVEPDGHAIIGGYFSQFDGTPRTGLARLNPDGSLDQSFAPQLAGAANGGLAVLDIHRQPDGQLIVSGLIEQVNGVRVNNVARLGPLGMPDPSFVPVLQLRQERQNSVRTSLASDGKILAGSAGMIATQNGFSGENVVRLNSDGTLDRTFNFRPPAEFIEAYAINAVAAQADGKVVVAGYFGTPNRASRGAVLRFSASGQFDTSYVVPKLPYFSVNSMVLLPGGNLIIWGWEGLYEFNSAARLVQDYGATSVMAVAAGADGDLIAAGQFTKLAGYDTGPIVRLFTSSAKPPPGPEFAQARIAAAESDSVAVIEIQRLGDTSQPATVQYSTRDGTARAGVEYQAQAGVIAFAPFQATARISVTLMNDALPGVDKTFTVALSEPSTGTALQLVREATVVIQQADSGLQFAQLNFDAFEDAGFVDVLVTRAGGSLGAASATFTTSDGSAKAGTDYLARTGDVAFAPGQTSQTVRVPVLDDGMVQGNRVFQLRLTGSRPAMSLGARAQATVTIHDNEVSMVVDPTFDPSGVLSSNNVAQAFAVQPDGKMVVVAPLNTPDQQPRLLRLNPDGTRDATFTNAMRFQGQVTGCLVQPDGKILVWEISGATDPALLRFNANGSPDASFNNTVQLRFRASGNFPQVMAVALQPDRKILVGGAFDSVNGRSQKNMARLHPNGALDEDFNIGQGVFTTSADAPDNSIVRSIVVQPGGLIVIQGYFRKIAGADVASASSNLARLHPDGLVDDTFSPTLPATLLLGASPDGKLLIGYQAPEGNTVRRLNADGILDPGFLPSAPGEGTVQLDWAGVAAVLADGHAVFPGYVVTAGQTKRGIVRLRADGALDPFYTGLRFITASGFPTYVGNLKLGLQADGRLIVAGDFASVDGVRRPGLVRLLGHPSDEPAFALSAPQYGASEADGLAAITVRRFGDTTRSASVEYSIAPAAGLPSAIPGQLRGTISFGPLESVKQIYLPLPNDLTPSDDKGFSVELSHPNPAANLGAGPAAAMVILSDGQRPGSLDPAFRPVLRSAGPSGTRTGLHLALQPDGAIVVAGGFGSVNGEAREGVCRLLPDGSIDRSFRSSPIRGPAPEGSAAEAPAIHAAVLQPDGKILVRGRFETTAGAPYRNLVRLEPDGALDESFVPEPEIEPQDGRGLAVQPDGKVLLVTGRQLTRLQADGIQDGTFEMTAVVGGGWFSQFDAIVVQPGNMPVLGGALESLVYRGDGTAQWLNRFNHDGSLDETFAPDVYSYVPSIVVQPDGKLLIAGSFGDISGFERPSIARLNPDGSLDASFAPRVPDWGGYNTQVLALQPDGKVLADGWDGARSSIFRFNADGSVDPTFQLDRQLLRPSLNLRITSLTVQPDGQILVAGTIATDSGDTEFLLVRLNGDGRLREFESAIRSIQRHNDGRVQLQVNGLPGRAYQLEASVNLKDWRVVTATKPTKYEFEIAAPKSNNAWQFYRLAEPMP